MKNTKNQLNHSTLLKIYVGVSGICTIIGGLAVMFQLDKIGSGEKSHSLLESASFFAISAAVTAHSLIKLNTENSPRSLLPI